MIKVDDNCPCGSLKCYTHCCHRYHGGDEFAPTAECLMRSRYSAFVIQNIDYIVQTTLPALQPLLDVAALKAWAEQTWWTYLKIISTTPKIGKRHAQVHFCVYFEELGVQGCHNECSAFVKINENGQNRWYFLDPTLPITLSGKQPCLCGSGEKFKVCCGKFL